MDRIGINKEGIEESKQTLYELFLGIVFFMFVEIFFCFYIVNVDNIARVIAGSVLGSVTAVFFLLHLYKSIDAALDMDEESAVKFSRKRAAIRLIVVAIVMFIAVFIARYVSIVAVFLGVMSVKFSVYLQPLTHRFISKRFR